MHDPDHPAITESCASSEADGTYAEGIVPAEQDTHLSLRDPRRASLNGVHVSDDHFTSTSSPARSAPSSPRKDAVTVRAVVDPHVFASQSAMTSNATQKLATQSQDEGFAPQSTAPSTVSSGSKRVPNALVHNDAPAWEPIPMVSPGEEEEGGKPSLFSRKHPKPTLPRPLHSSDFNANFPQAPNPMEALPAAVGSLARTVLPTIANAVKSVVAYKLEPGEEDEHKQVSSSSPHSPGHLSGPPLITSTTDLMSTRSAAPPTASTSPPSPMGEATFLSIIPPPHPHHPPKYPPEALALGSAHSNSSRSRVLSPDSDAQHLRDPLGAVGMESDEEDTGVQDPPSRPLFSAQQHPSTRARYSESDNDSIGSFHGASTSNSVNWPSPMASRSRQRGQSQGGESLSLEQPTSSSAGAMGEVSDHDLDAGNVTMTSYAAAVAEVAAEAAASAPVVSPARHGTETAVPERSVRASPGSSKTADTTSDLPNSSTSPFTGPGNASVHPVSALAQEVVSQTADASTAEGFASGTAVTQDPVSAAGASRDFNPIQAGGSSGGGASNTADPARFRQHTMGVPRRSGGMSGDDLLLSATRKLQLGATAPTLAMPSLPAPMPISLSDSSPSIGGHISAPELHQDPPSAYMSGNGSSTWAHGLHREVQSKTRTPLAAAAIQPVLLRPPPAYSPMAPPETPAPQGM